MTSPIIFHNLFDDDETDAENEDTLSEVAVPVLYSVEELFTMMAEFNTAAAASEHVDKNDKAEEGNVAKEEESSIDVDQPKKKLRPSRPLKYKNAICKDVVSIKQPTSSVKEPSETQDISETIYEEQSELREASLVSKDGSKEITLKMGSRHVKPAKNANLDHAYPELNNKTQQSIPQSKSVVVSPIVIKHEKAETDEKVMQSRNKSTKIKVVQSVEKVSSNVKKPTQVTKIKQEPGMVKTERLFLPSTVRVTLVKEEDEVKVHTGASQPSKEVLSLKIAEKEDLILSQQKMVDEFKMKNEEIQQALVLKEELISSQQIAIDELEKKSINVVKAEELSHKIAEKEELILSQQKMISDLGIKNEEVEQKLVLREEFIDSQQKVIDELEKQSVNAHKVEKLSSTIAEKEELLLSHLRIIKELGMKNEEIQQNLLLREEFIDSQQKVIDDLEKQSINTHKVEKLSNDLQEKMETISRLLESEEKLKSQLHKSEESSETFSKVRQDLMHQLSMLKSDYNLKITEIKNLVEKCSALEKEKEVLTEIGNSHRSTSEDILKTVEALKEKIDDVITNDSREEEFMSQISNLKNEIMKLTVVKKDLEEEVTSVKMSLYTKTEESSLLEEALSEKIGSNAQLEKEISKLSDKLKEMKKSLDHKSSKVSKMEKENGKLKEKMKDLEKEIELKTKECTSFRKTLDEKIAEKSSTNEELEKFKVQLTEMEERLNLETGKSVELIKKLNFSEKLVFTKENDYLALRDQQLLLESKLRINQRKIEEYEKDNIKFVEANLKVKCLEDEKKDLLKEIRKVSELQKKVKFLESKLKKYYNFYKKQTGPQPEELEESTSILPGLEVMDIPDPKEIDAILNQISQDVTKHTESIAAEVCIKEIPLPITEQSDSESPKVISTEVSGPHEESLSSSPYNDDLKLSNTSLEEEDGLLHAWKSRMKQAAQFSEYPSSKPKLVDIFKFSPVQNDVNTKDIPTKAPYEENDVDSLMSAEVDDIVVISSHEFKSSGKKKQISSDSDDEDNERSRKHKSKRSKKRRKKYKSKTEDKERSRERKRHRSRKKSGSPIKTRSRSRSRSRNNKRAQKEGRKSRSRSIRRNNRSPSKSKSRSRSNNTRRKVHKEGRKQRSRSRSISADFKQKIRNVSHSPGKRSKRPRSSSPSKPVSQSISSESPRKRFQPRLKSKSKSPAVVKDANFALSKEISSIIEKLQEAKTDNVATTSPITEVSDASMKHDTLAMKDVKALPKNPNACKSITNIVANYSSEFEEISDEELTLAEDCVDEPEQISNSKENESIGRNEIPSFGLLPEKVEEVDEKMLKERVDKDDFLNADTSEIKSTEASPLSVFFNLNCSCCGGKLTGSVAEDAQHFEEGECKKKSDWLKQGLPLICAYCTKSGTHWVAACPLLASFCFTCWTWGHSMDTHVEEDKEKTVVRLLSCYNRFRLNHLANSGRSEQYKVFPSNSKVEGMWRFMGSMEDVDSVARKIPGHMGKPVSWLTQENWVRLRGLEIKKET